MRIIGGKHRGKILKEFKGKEIRPTSDRAREALFNILQFSIAQSDFLDAFCGSGGVGIEAISRGANSVVFTDISDESIALTKSNLALVKENSTVLKSDAVDYLTLTNRKFDFIFIDPPYASSKGIDALKVIAERHLLKDNGVAIFEHRFGENHAIDGLFIEKSKKYGIAEFSFYKELK